MNRQPRNRLNDHRACGYDAPSPNDIQLLCREIRSNWSDVQKKHRAAGHRLDHESLQFRAHLRFIEFLASRSERSS